MGKRGPTLGDHRPKRAFGRRVGERKTSEQIPAGRYLLGSGDRVRVPLHQLLERDGLRVRSAGDLKMRGESAGAVVFCLPPIPPSLTPVPQAGTRG